MPRERARICDAFVSATAKDARRFRLGVGKALEPLKVAVFLQEYWAYPAIDVVTLCLNRIGDSDAYLGVFGFRYGWVPDKHTRSITELEYDKALDLWGAETVPPIFVFLPEPGKAAAKMLAKAAEAELAREYDQESDREESRRLQKQFCDRMRRNSRFVVHFETLAMLQVRAAAAVANWNLEIVRAAEAARPQPGLAGIPDSELGAIGRDEQVRSINRTFAAASKARAVGLCVVIHGPEDAGQFEFRAYLEAANPWEISRPVQRITPSHVDAVDVPSLIAATLKTVAPDLIPPAATIDVLAAALLERSRDEPVVMSLAVDRVRGELEGFRTGFWRPLVESAQRQAPAFGKTQPFVVVVSLASELPSPLPAGFAGAPAAGAAAPDPRDLVVAPVLGGLTEDDVSEWLKGHDMKRAERDAIAARAVKDGRPSGVFYRLNAADFWRLLAR